VDHRETAKFNAQSIRLLPEPDRLQFVIRLSQWQENEPDSNQVTTFEVRVRLDMLHTAGFCRRSTALEKTYVFDRYEACCQATLHCFYRPLSWFLITLSIQCFRVTESEPQWPTKLNDEN
jgi:hypothetical protein